MPEHAVSIQDPGTSARVAVSSAGALTTSDAGMNQAQGSTTSGQTGPLVQGAVATNSPTYTNAQTSPVSLTTSGRLRVDVSGSVIAMTTAGTSLSAVTSNQAGTAVDLTAAFANIVTVVTTTGTPTGGTVTLEVSVDNTSWFTTTTTATVGSGVTMGTLSGTAVRYARATLSGLTGGTSPTVTAKIMASG